MNKKILLYQLTIIFFLLTSYTSEPRQQERYHDNTYLLLNQDLSYSVLPRYHIEKSESLKKRFKQSVELIKLLYEKLLDLDHHFSGMDISHKVTKLSNPNAYPEFHGLQENMNRKNKQRREIEIPEVLESNLYVSASLTIVKVLFGKKNKGPYKEEIEKIACILDFTVRMEKDLNTIYYETEYLKNVNQKMINECELLFDQCLQVIGYHNSLADCRNMDDWENVFQLLDEYILDIENNIVVDSTFSAQLLKEEVNLKFAIDRVVTFIQDYNDFVKQGDNYYKKFHVIISNYRNQEFCGNNLPEEFFTLKSDIDLTIEKFNNSYNLPELKGSKLKELMYGTTHK